VPYAFQKSSGRIVAGVAMSDQQFVDKKTIKEKNSVLNDVKNAEGDKKACGCSNDDGKTPAKPCIGVAQPCTVQGQGNDNQGQEKP